ncbi:MAG: hypothetical protein XU14_C0096G0003 [Armatimonadetes bacterium CSP1-3]|nr:MAG: hypothetical protein XU14_C0096G0003 [Armatimonadetes bacterium CSP1-3]
MEAEWEKVLRGYTAPDKEARGWALIRAEGTPGDAISRLVSLARARQWSGAGWTIRRIDVVDQVQIRTPSGPAYGLFVAVKGRTDKDVDDAFDVIEKILHTKSPEVDRYRARNSLEIDW